MDWSKDLKPSASADGAAILSRERQRSDVDVEKLSESVFGKAYLERQRRVVDILGKEKVFSKATQANLSRPDRYALGLARGKRMRQLMDEHRWSQEDLLMAEYLIDDILPYHLHLSLFANAMKEQCSEEQRLYWLPKMEAWEIIGAYAQTELGHGSNVRGIELEARWDHQTKEFVLHSPTLTASKWWNGTLGRTATHAVVVAQLLLPQAPNRQSDYQSVGPRLFIVQVRDAKTHQPPSSIIVGDIGPKYGYASMDNGYMLFKQHRIPHSALLSRYASLDPTTGVYTRPKNASSMYGQLTKGRSVIVMNSRLVLARAVTVATRYLAIRRQFRDQDGVDGSAAETPVLDYSTVQIRILPLLATAFALHYSGNAMRDLYQRTRGSSSLESDNAQFAELHSTSAGLKSMATDLSANGIEICRRAMGGHGFGQSGLVQINADWLSKPTVEGDNWMITQQVARYLIKKVKERADSPDRPTNSPTECNLKAFWDNRNKAPGFSISTSDSDIVDAFNWRASWLAFRAYEAREIQKRPWNSLLIGLHKLSRAYSQAMLVSNFYDAVRGGAGSDSNSHQVMTLLFRLFSFYTMDAEAREFQTCGATESDVLDQLPDKILTLMGEVRPHSVRLVDALAIPDYLLDSALGRYDGKVYEDLFHRAHVLNPLNKTTFNPDYRNNEIVKGSGDGSSIVAKL